MYRFLVGLSVSLNRVLGGRPGTPVCARCHRARTLLCRLLCWLMDLVEEGHCRKAHENYPDA